MLWTATPAPGPNGRDYDGQVTSLVVVDQRRIVRGLDRARLDQALGFIGC